MFKRTICIILTAIFALSVLCSCSKEEDITLTAAISADPVCLDPQIADTDSAKTIINNCFEGLVRLDENFAVIPGVAEKWEISADGLTYTFHLRSDTNWQILKSFEGVIGDKDYLEKFNTKVTAYDFQFALRRAIDPATQADDADKLYCIKNARQIHSGSASVNSLGVTAKDDSTLIITLERKNDDFLRILTLPVCMPCNKEFFDATHAKYGLEVKYTLCNGPFYLSKWVADNVITMYRNEGYRGNSQVKPTMLYFYINADEDSVVSKIKQKSYNCAYLSDTAHTELSGNKKITQLASPVSIYGMCFNCTDSILSNENIRKALLCMTDPSLITCPDGTQAAGGIIPNACRFGEKSYREVAGNINLNQYDGDKGIELWHKGLNELDSESVKITILCTENFAPQMQNVIQRWQKLLGTEIVAEVVMKTEDEIETGIKKDAFQIAVCKITAESATTMDLLEKFTTDYSGNISNFSGKSYDKAIEDIKNNCGGNEIISKTKAAEQMLVDNAVFFPLYTGNAYFALGKGINGIYTSPALESVCFINGGAD